MKSYIAALQVQAELSKDESNYIVTFVDGWTTENFVIPKDQFEAHFFPMFRANSVSDFDIVNFYEMGKEELSTIGQKTTMLHVTLPSGFEDVEASSCVDPANYNEDIGAQICTDRIKEKLWDRLGFMLQWARHGLTTY